MSHLSDGLKAHLSMIETKCKKQVCLRHQKQIQETKWTNGAVYRTDAQRNTTPVLITSAHTHTELITTENIYLKKNLFDDRKSFQMNLWRFGEIFENLPRTQIVQSGQRDRQTDWIDRTVQD